MNGASDSQRAYARIAGLFYLLVLVFDIAGLVVTSTVAGSGGFAESAGNIAAGEWLYRVGLTLALLGTMATVPLAVGLYVTLRPADPGLALMGLLFRAVEVAVGAVGVVGSFAILQVYLAANQHGAFGASQLSALTDLDPLGASTKVAAVSFCIGSTIFFYVFLKARYIPRLMAAWGVFASLLYLALWVAALVAPGLPGLVSVIGSVPILIAEVSTGLWLLIAGIRVSAPQNAAGVYSSAGA